MSSSNLVSLINEVEGYIEDPTKGLPEEVFLFATQITPMVNVDLLIKNRKGQILLSWRDDEYCGTGWHIPGGIIRLKEKIEDRITKTGQKELGCILSYNPRPLAVNQLIEDQKTRSHFISFLYECYVPDDFIIDNKDLKPTDVGYMKWHDKYPEDMIAVHDIYREFFEEDDKKWNRII